MDPRLKHPFTMMIAGPTGSGKTYFVTRLLQHLPQMITPQIERVIWCYSKWQPGYEKLKPYVTQWVEGIKFEEFTNPDYNTLVVLDDLQRESQDGQVASLFERGSHHDNISVIFITQNIFHQGKDSRDISLNTHYLALFKNPRDRSQITFLAKQVYPHNSKFLQDAYDHATKEPHGYLFLDFKQKTDEALRVRTYIFPDDPIKRLYQPKKK